MNLREISRLKVTGTIESPGETPRVVLENKASGAKIELPGKILEAQYQIGDDFLVLLTEGNPYEEGLYIYFLNKHLEQLDSLELSAMYATGVLTDISISSLYEISFSFFDSDERWVLRVHSTPRYAPFGHRHPVKRRRSVFDKSWLSLKKI